MSYQSWCEEFYPIPASEVEEKDAIQHSLTKWIGLRKENLEKHGLKMRASLLCGDIGTVLKINTGSCALCHYYYEGDEESYCAVCPLAAVRDDTPCDHLMYMEKDSPYGIFVDDSNPEPMIEWLQKCLSAVNSK